MPENSTTTAHSTGSTECFYLDAQGRKQDAAIHDAWLNDPVADETAAQWDVADAVRGGMTVFDAVRAYGTDRMQAERGLMR